MPNRNPHENWSRVPFDKLHYRITPTMMRSTASAHGSAGYIKGLKFSYYVLRRLRSEARLSRVASYVRGEGKRITLDEVTHVLAGDLLPPKRADTMTLVRRASLLVDVVGEVMPLPGESTSPERSAVYIDLGTRGDKQGATLWSQLVDARKLPVLEAHRGSVKVAPSVKRLYEWMDEDELLGSNPIFRAAMLLWALPVLLPDASNLGIYATIDHELYTAGLNPLLLYVPTEFSECAAFFRIANGVQEETIPAHEEGDLTPLFEGFARVVALSMDQLKDRLDRVRDKEDKLPWLVMQPPDDIDRQIFTIVEKRGSVRSQQILSDMKNPPPLRTLQRHLKHLVAAGLIAKVGSRKHAFYRMPDAVDPLRHLNATT